MTEQELEKARNQIMSRLVLGAQSVAEEASLVGRAAVVGAGVAELNTRVERLRHLTREDVPWQCVYLFQVDERIAPARHHDRNLTQLKEDLLSFVPLPPDQVYAMSVESSDLETATAQYASTLQKVAGQPRDCEYVGELR